MQTANFRYLVLITLALAGAGLYSLFGDAHGNTGAPRWPDTDALYAVDQWSTGPATVQHNSDAGHYTDLVTRTFRNPAGTVATLTIGTSQAPKLYGAGAEVPFLGSGFMVRPALADLNAGTGDGAGVLVAQRGTEQWLVMYAYGERRGLLGNGPLAWTFAVFDGILARPNDYYKLYLASRNDLLNPRMGSDVATLAHTLFARIATWYAA